MHQDGGEAAVRVGYEEAQDNPFVEINVSVIERHIDPAVPASNKLVVRLTGGKRFRTLLRVMEMKDAAQRYVVYCINAYLKVFALPDN